MLDSQILSAESTDNGTRRRVWTGCDWTTQFGDLRLDLCGIRSRQARTVAAATRGHESEQWHAAANWLASVEADAKLAGELQNQLVAAERSADSDQVARLRTALLAIETKYPRG